MVLLTGATGSIGGRLRRALEEGGHRVRCLARQPEKVSTTRPTSIGQRASLQPKSLPPLPADARRTRGVSCRIRLALALALAAVLSLTLVQGEQIEPVRTVDAVDLDRYLGDWFEIARFPNTFQRRCVGDVRARYARRADDRLDVINQCRTADGAIEAHGVARIVDARTSAKLKVRFAPVLLSFLPSVWGDYWILGLADDYSWAVVGSPDRKYLWILARAPALDPATFTLAAAVARDNGFDTGRLSRTSHASDRREEAP